LVLRVPLSPPEQNALRQSGSAIRGERTALGMTPERLEEQTRLHLRTVQKIEAEYINELIITVQRIQKTPRCSRASLIA
jgi:hypothetical protein